MGNDAGTKSTHMDQDAILSIVNLFEPERTRQEIAEIAGVSLKTVQYVYGRVKKLGKELPYKRVRNGGAGVWDGVAGELGLG